MAEFDTQYDVKKVIQRIPLLKMEELGKTMSTSLACL